MADEHYAVFISKPNPKSYFAFLLTAASILDADPGLPLWMPPVAIDDTMDAETRNYLARHNSGLEAIEAQRRQGAVAQLVRAGVDPARLVEPVAPEVNDTLCALIEHERQALRMLYDSPPDPRPFKMPVRVIAGCCDLERRTDPKFRDHAVHRRVTSILNEGIPAGNRTQGLTLDHIFRADSSFRKALFRRCRRALSRDHVDAILVAQFVWTEIVLRPLAGIYKESRTRPDLRHLSGEALARAIDEKCGLGAWVERAAGRFSRAA